MEGPRLEKENRPKLEVVSPRPVAHRRLASWVDAFGMFTAKTGSPHLFRKWAAIYTVAAAMERKTWIRTARRIMYPNMYVILVGPAGAGKGLATNEAYDL